MAFSDHLRTVDNSSTLTKASRNAMLVSLYYNTIRIHCDIILGVYIYCFKSLFETKYYCNHIKIAKNNTDFLHDVEISFIA